MTERSKQQVFDCGEDDWTPTPHGLFLGEVIAKNDFVRGKELLELGAGVGNHTTLLLNGGAKSVVATEVSEDRLETTRTNVTRLCGPDAPVDYRVADWLHTDGRFEMLVTNPPFARSGMRNRRYFIDELILNSFKRLRPRGELCFVQSSMADLERTLDMLDRNGYDARVVDQQEHPWRDYYLEDSEFLKESEQVPDGFIERNGQRFEVLSVLLARLRTWEPPAFAH